MSKDKIIAMIPARLGSQRLARKNLREIDGVSLIALAMRKCKEAGSFSEIWVNSESDEIGDVARYEGVSFYKRPEQLANSIATSEQFVADFLEHHPCDAVVQVHSIAPLLSTREVAEFVDFYKAASDLDVLLSCIHDQIEVAFRGKPVNFTFAEKTNSQDLEPLQRITWSIAAWRREPFLAAARAGKTATYSGKIGFFPVSAISGHVIKTEDDLKMAQALIKLMK